MNLQLNITNYQTIKFILLIEKQKMSITFRYSVFFPKFADLKIREKIELF